MKINAIFMNDYQVSNKKISTILFVPENVLCAQYIVITGR